MKPTDYAQLARPFDHVFRDKRGGVTFDYFTGEQAVSRLMEQGPGFASFEIVEHGINDEADEVWVLGKLTCRIVERNPAAEYNNEGRYIIGDQPHFIVVPTVMMQFGSQKIKRSRSNGKPLDIGFDLKGAATDSYKKCASQGVGVGLYLWRKDGGIPSIPDDGVPIEAEYTDVTPQGARRCSARISPEETCAEIVPEGESIMAAMREFDRPLCADHLAKAREHMRAIEEQEKTKALREASTAETGHDLVQEAMQAPPDAPQSSPEARTATKPPETTPEPPDGNQAENDDSDIKVINGRSVRARTCDAKDRATQTICGYKLWPGTTTTYGGEEFKVSVLISESLAKHKRVLCPEHYVRMNEYASKRAAPASA